MAGQQVQEILRKLNVDHHVNWVEMIPKVLRLLHDAPGESGLSPYEIIFGRERFCARVPYEPPRTCEDAQDFFERMSANDRRVAEILNEMHKKSAGRINAKRKPYEVFPIGSVVWYRRPEGSGGKMDSRWLGPAEVLARNGENSYEIRTGQNTKITAQASYLKKYWPDTQNEECKPMFYHKRTVQIPEEETTQPQVKRILGRRIIDGEHEFLTQKVGETIDDAVYLKPQDFLGEAGQKLVDFCKENDIQDELGIFNPGADAFVESEEDIFCD